MGIAAKRLSARGRAIDERLEPSQAKNLIEARTSSILANVLTNIASTARYAKCRSAIYGTHPWWDEQMELKACLGRYRTIIHIDYLVDGRLHHPHVRSLRRSRSPYGNFALGPLLWHRCRMSFEVCYSSLTCHRFLLAVDASRNLGRGCGGIPQDSSRSALATAPNSLFRSIAPE